MTLQLASDRPDAMIAARLEDVAPDGASTLVTYGFSISRIATATSVRKRW